ncbi:MAG: FxsA protein [Bdellovibrionaceae bacterium]|nr:FxsA protein [Pseudobdellovibrionaceae bacterium]|tara:strand:+ start:72145 stop:72669 length:525 start_codon:yes stop_codon:yes gene_type:complete
MIFLLLFLFTLMPVVELYLLFQVADIWGGGNTVMLVLLTGFVGAFLARSQGRQVLMQIQSQMTQGQVPADAMIHGLLIFAGGLLLVTPGIITDVFGFSFVLPGTRNLISFFLKRWFSKKIQLGQVQFYSSGKGGPQSGFHYQSTQFYSDSEGTTPRDVTPREIKDINSRGDESL